MAEPGDANHDRWQTYWGAVRRGVWIVLVLGVVGFVTGLLEIAVREHGSRVALAAVIAVVVVAAANVVIDRLAARRQPGAHRP